MGFKPLATRLDDRRYGRGVVCRLAGPLATRIGVCESGICSKTRFNWHSPDNRECAKRVSLISCRDIGHSSYTGIIFRIARLLRL
ncbi:MAG: hypothetical protein WA624_04880, partial [Methylocella sp.]